MPVVKIFVCLDLERKSSLINSLIDTASPVIFLDTGERYNGALHEYEGAERN